MAQTSSVSAFSAQSLLSLLTCFLLLSPHSTEHGAHDLQSATHPVSALSPWRWPPTSPQNPPALTCNRSTASYDCAYTLNTQRRYEVLGASEDMSAPDITRMNSPNTPFPTLAPPSPSGLHTTCFTMGHSHTPLYTQCLCDAH